MENQTPKNIWLLNLWLGRQNEALRQLGDAQDYVDFCEARLDSLLAEAGVVYEPPELYLIQGGLHAGADSSPQATA